MTVRAPRGAKPGRIAAIVSAAALLVAFTTPASAQQETPAPQEPTAAEVALCWGLLGGGAGAGAMLAADNWRVGDPGRPPPAYHRTSCPGRTCV